MKRKIKVYGKIQLYETSVVGIPAYPDAHASVESFSLIKALSNATRKGFVEEGVEISQLNFKEEKETMEEKSQAVIEEKAVEQAVEAPIAEKKSEMSEDFIAKAIKEGIKEGLKELETERGLVEKQAPMTAKSLGELAIEQGFFVKK